MGVRRIVEAFSQHKDACLALGAIVAASGAAIAPFAAVFVGLRTSKRQAAASLKAAEIQSAANRETAKLQIEAQTAIAQKQMQASVGISYRQRINDQIREMLIWHLEYAAELLRAAYGRHPNNIADLLTVAPERSQRLTLLCQRDVALPLLKALGKLADFYNEHARQPGVKWEAADLETIDKLHSLVSERAWEIDDSEMKKLTID